MDTLLLFFLIPGRSQVIALRRTYCGDFSRSCFYYKSIILVCCFPCCFSCSEQVTGDSFEREL
jgi:hypothetical protein